MSAPGSYRFTTDFDRLFDRWVAEENPPDRLALAVLEGCMALVTDPRPPWSAPLPGHEMFWVAEFPTTGVGLFYAISDDLKLLRPLLLESFD